MKSSLTLLGCLVLSSLAHAQNVFYSKPELANQSVGYIDTSLGRYSYRGSGTVARDPRLIYSCAHIVYDRGKWADDYTFYRAIHQRGFPSRSLAASPRGFHVMSRYARAARYTNGESNRSFAADFTVFYGPVSFGPAVPVQENSGQLLRSFATMKRIVGYPAQIDYTGDRGYYYQHNTGWFSKQAFRIRGGFNEFYRVSTGPGNSGGAAFLRDPGTGADRFAGVLVSGGRNSAGVMAMTGATRRVSDAALGSAASRTMSRNRNRISLGASRTSATRILPMRELSGIVTDMTLHIEMETASPSSTKVWLQSPGGRVHRVRSCGTTSLADAFRGSETEGDWQLRIQVKDGSPSTFSSATLTAYASTSEAE